MNYVVVMCCCHTFPPSCMSAGHDAIISRHSLPPGCTFPSLPPSARDRNIALADPLLATNRSLAGDLLARVAPVI